VVRADAALLSEAVVTVAAFGQRPAWLGRLKSNSRGFLFSLLSLLTTLPSPKRIAKLTGHFNHVLTKKYSSNVQSNTNGS
jgi:hypothetical protein